MKLTLTALFDEDTRKQVQEAILGEARGIARSAIDLTVNEEIRRIITAMLSTTSGYRYALNDRINDQIRDIVRSALTTSWDPIKQEMDKLLEAAAEKLIAKKLADKTVWEAKSQDEYIRKVLREELTRMLKP